MDTQRVKERHAQREQSGKRKATAETKVTDEAKELVIDKKGGEREREEEDEGKKVTDSQY